MSVIYCKSSINRRKEFQIRTVIIEKDKHKYVIKKPIFDVGIKHIRNIGNNGQLLKKVNIDLILPSVYENKMVITPYVEGVSLGEKLIKHLGKEEVIRRLLAEWKELIEGNETNICKFYMTQGFKDIFGEEEELLGDRATSISNVDCSSDNVIFLDSQDRKVIDYEWVFDFPIPVDFLFYRVLKMFYDYNRDFFEWEKLLALSLIDVRKLDIYERIAQKFDEYVTFDKIRNLNYNTIGKKFRESRIIEKRASSFLYRFPYDLIPQGSCILLYGAGRVGMDFYNLIKATKYCKLVLWLDKQADFYQKQGLEVYDCSCLSDVNYDVLLIAVLNESVSLEIRNELRRLGIPNNKIVWTRVELI